MNMIMIGGDAEQAAKAVSMMSFGIGLGKYSLICLCIYVSIDVLSMYIYLDVDIDWVCIYLDLVIDWVCIYL